MIMNNPEVLSDECVPQETYIDNVVLAHAYVPIQKLCGTYSPLGALVRGTAFPPLYNVYGWETMQRVDYDD